jgi:hypothetical protein
MMLVKANRIVVNDVSYDCPYAGDLGYFKASPDPVEQQIRAKPFALELPINGQPAQKFADSLSNINNVPRGARCK